MNERIKALYKQATGKKLANDFDAGVLEAERFAQLIVRECARVANENVGAFTPGCGDSVLEHFGVEE